MNNSTGTTEYITRIQAANLIGVTTKTIDRYARIGLITKYRAKRGSTTLLDRAEVEALTTPEVAND